MREGREQKRSSKGLAGKAVSLDELMVQALLSRPVIHKDFIFIAGWYRKGVWGPSPKWPQKVCCFFDDPSLLDNCPWVGKFNLNKDPSSPHRYFGVFYGNPLLDFESGFKEMEKWALKFPKAGVYTYGEYREDRWLKGSFVRAIR